MTERARKPMSATEFLGWDDGTDARHELIDGVPVAMAPGNLDHGRLTGNLFRIVDDATRRCPPCRAIPDAGILLSEGPPGRVYIPDVLMTCEPIDGRHLCEAPRLVVEVLSPSTQGYDKTTKLPVYASLPSVEEIWLVSSRARSVQVWERRETEWHAGLPIIGKARFTSRVLNIEIGLDDIYALTSLDFPSEQDGP